MRLREFVARYKRRCQKKHMKSIAPYIRISDGLIYRDNFHIELRDPKPGHIYMETGVDDVLDGNYIFETDSGHIKIGDRTYIGGGMLISRSEITIGNDVMIAWGCLIYDHDSHSIYWNERKNDIVQVHENLKKGGQNPIHNKNWDVVKSKPIHICDKAWIGAQCIILKGVTIGEGAVIGAGSVVASDVEPWTVVAGNPARVINRISF